MFGTMFVMLALLLAARKTGAVAPQAPSPTKPPQPPPATPTAAPAAAAKPAAAPAAPAVPWPVASYATAPGGKVVPVPTFQMGPLPAFPSGWEADTPPTKAVTTRAGQLLGELWKSGKPGATKQEQIAGRWVTFQAYAPAKGKRAVVAYRIKGQRAAA